MRIFLISPVRNVKPEVSEAIRTWVAAMEAMDHKVHWPERDTDQKDQIGLRICSDNRTAIESADLIYVWFDPLSQGTIFDLGMAFALRKPVRLVNSIESTIGKSFQNMLLALSDPSRQDIK